MVEIMKHLHQYVPYVERVEEVEVSTQEKVDLCKEAVHKILVGGDKTTAVRVRSDKRARANSDTPLKRLIPVIEDWHTKANFMGVSIIHVLVEWASSR